VATPYVAGPPGPKDAAPEPEQLSAALRRWLAGKFGGEVADVSPPARMTGGMDMWTYAVHVASSCLPAEWSAPLIARIPGRTGRFPLLERESRLQGWAAACGYPAPPLVELIPPGEVLGFPVQVSVRMPGIAMAAVMTARPWRIPRLARQLGAVHAALHRLPVPEWADSGAPEWADSSWSLAGRRLALSRRAVPSGRWPALAAGLVVVERILPRLQVPDPVTCHGDFHPLNVLVAGERVTVIDWTDAGIGDRHGDIARTAWLFRFAAELQPGRARRLLIRALAPGLAHAYLSSYRRQLPVQKDRLRLWMPLHLLHAWTAAETAGQTRLAAWAERQFRRSVADLPG
jgi:aminoglycoside phosphotransferase (APT) family kinase protein